jgi:putative sterol carrier protein
MRFPSAEWAEAFRVELNESPAFQEAAAAWEVDLLFRVRTPGDPGPAPGIRLDIAHGTCRGAVFHPDATAIAAEFVFEGTAENWQRLLRRELDPVRSFMDGTFKVRGNLAKALRFTRAAKELVEVAAGIPIDASAG